MAARFLKALFEAASSDKHRSIVWNQAGNGLVILDKLDFIKNTLPLICKTDEYGTFIRQLNNYGFSKIKSGNSDEFVNERFLRSSPESLVLLRRKVVPEKDKANELRVLHENQETLQSNMEVLNDINKKLLNEMYYLKERVQRQERTINELVKALFHIFNKKESGRGNLKIENSVIGDKSRIRGDLKNMLSDISGESADKVMELEEDKEAEADQDKEIDLDMFLNSEFGR